MSESEKAWQDRIKAVTQKMSGLEIRVRHLEQDKRVILRELQKRTEAERQKS